MPILYSPENHVFHLQNANISYIIRLVAGKYPIHQYWGRRVRAIHADAMERFCTQEEETFTLHGLPLDTLPQECPVYGCGDLRQGMLEVRQADGSSALDLCYVSHEILKGKPALKGLPSARGDDAETLVLRLQDEHSGVEVELSYTVYPDVDVIARNLRVINGGQFPLVLEKALSACVDFENAHEQLMTLSGACMRERQIYTRPLTPGNQGVESVRGASSHQACPFMALLKPGAAEDSGDVYALSLCYSGSFLANVFVDSNDMARVQIGIQPFQFSWELKPGEDFQTPEAYLCYSPNGLNGMSREFHHLCSRYITRGAFAHAARPLLINNWEATYFNFNEEKLLELASCAKNAGIDLFVLDDGWFGHRDLDNCSLGDWVDDRRKLPDGLRGLSDRIHGLGLKFGLWLEPEMISPDSDLYRAHPDWCIHIPGRMQVESRNQLVLDLNRKDVREYVIDAVCAAMERGNVDYVKWDMNRNINMLHSDGLDSAHQKELNHRYILGLYEILEAVTSRFPNVLFESCAGGGGRFDFGMMYYMPQAWCSDDSDAFMRCRIQYGTSMLFPVSTMGAHVSAVPNHQTGRITPLFTRAAVAMSGTYGYELDLTKLPEEELEEIRRLNEKVKALQPLLLYGEFYRLRSPFEGNETAFMSVSEDQSEAIVTHVYGPAQPNMLPVLLPLRGLDPEKDYRDVESGRIYGGDELMTHGLTIPRTWGDYMATQFHLVAVK